MGVLKEKGTARDRIMEAAEAVFAEKGYHDAVVDDIVHRTDLSKGGIYFHFPSKERLFFAVLDHLSERLVVRIRREVSQEKLAIAKLDIALTTVLASLSKRRRLAKLMLVQGYSMGNGFEKKRIEIYSKFASLIKENLDLAIDEGSIPAIDTNIASHIWLGAMNEVLILWLYTGAPVPNTEALPVLKKLLFGGIGADIKSSVGG